MKKALKKNELDYFYFADGNKIDGAPIGVHGDMTDVRGDMTGVRGDMTDVRGDMSGVYGDMSGVRGDLDECEISDDDRKNGVNISDLIGA